MDTINFRVEKIREHLGLSQGAYSKQLDIPLPTYINYRKGRTPPIELIVKIAELYKVDLKWLLIGEGEMFGPTHSLTDANRKDCPNFIPLLGPAGAGPHGFTVSGDFAREWVPCPYGLEKRKDKLFGFTVSGMSMYPKFRDGDVVVCERKEPYYPAIDDEVVVMLTEGFETMVKLWRRKGALVSLESYNSQLYAPIEVSPEQIKDKAKVIDVIWGSRLKEMSYIQPDDLPNGK